MTGFGALGYGVAEPGLMVAVCLFPLAVGTAIALMMDSKVMGCAAVAGAILTLGVGATRGLGGMMAIAGLGALLIAGAGMLGLVALAKLMLWDWPQIGPVTRLAMMASVGTTLLLTPLFFPPLVAGHDHDKPGNRRNIAADDRAPDIRPISLQH